VFFRGHVLHSAFVEAMAAAGLAADAGAALEFSGVILLGIYYLQNKKRV